MVRAIVFLLALAQLSWHRPVLAQGAVENIASQLICQCGCGKLLSVCEMDTARQMKSIIGDKLAEGWSTQAVIDYMTDTYGEQVLAAPTKKGFNLTAWITPFALILLGAITVWFVVAAWVQHRRRTREEEVRLVASEDLEAKYGATLEKELREFEG